MAKFRTRARTVDMLGRQQIAGIPTAISELFKNAHDAYADSVEVDYFLPERLFVARDDGCGMTKDEFEDRWLTLGTESKVLTAGTGQSGLRTLGKKLRPIMGEKGIGRLAIAVIGPQVLVLTRAGEDAEGHGLVAALVNWGLFTLPNVNLEQIEVPVRIFPGDSVPSENDIADMVGIVRRNVEDIRKRNTDNESIDQILSELGKFKLDLHKLGPFINRLGSDGPRHGTQFYILPASEDLGAEIDIDIAGKEPSKLRKLLLGFTNTMVADKKKSPHMSTHFRYWKTANQFEDLIDEREFFVPQEFETADHRISGSFDDSGQFGGTVRVFGNEHRDCAIPWARGLGRQTSCGPFDIDVAYVSGPLGESRMAPEDHALLSKKLRAIGGLYIYRDGIRVLPYGDPEVDFLRFEERRSKSAGYYFFSYRRMFGYIAISRKNNSGLAEKAGREGFQENGAYREFKAILENFFVQLAADFFREGGSHAEEYKQAITERRRAQKALRERERQSLIQRRVFQAKLEDFFSRVESDETQDRIKAILYDLRAGVEAVFKQWDPDQAAPEITKLQDRAIRDLESVRQQYRLQRPRSTGLTKQLERDWSSYVSQVDQLERDIFLPAEKAIAKTVGEAIQRSNLQLERRKMADHLLEEFVGECRGQTKIEIENTQNALGETQGRLAELSRSIVTDISNAERALRKDLDKKDLERMSTDDMVVQRERFQGLLRSRVEGQIEILQQVRNQLAHIRWAPDEEGDLISEEKVTAALEGEVLALREESEENLELAQLGMAIDAINHEFQSTVKSIRTSLRELRRWGKANPELGRLHANITDDFNHLDSYLALFTPLHRRLYLQPQQISGEDIEKFLLDLFGERLHRTGVVLKASPEFRRRTIVGYRSTFYPVFINLVDNAIFWVKDGKPPFEITLDVRGDDLVVRNTGPRIAPRDRDVIFERGFTRKPGGRGLGLYISRRVLRKEGLDLRLGDSEDRVGAVFVISASPRSDAGPSEEAK